MLVLPDRGSRFSEGNVFGVSWLKPCWLGGTLLDLCQGAGERGLDSSDERYSIGLLKGCDDPSFSGKSHLFSGFPQRSSHVKAL